jgi:DNA polymerase eta
MASASGAGSSRSGGGSRVVALVDLDCFYCVCERFLDPTLNGVPLAVLQYNPYENSKDGTAIGGVVSLPAEPASARIVYKGGKLRMPSAQNGSIIAVSYEARARHVRQVV